MVDKLSPPPASPRHPSTEDETMGAMVMKDGIIRRAIEDALDTQEWRDLIEHMIVVLDEKQINTASTIESLRYVDSGAMRDAIKEIVKQGSERNKTMLTALRQDTEILEELRHIRQLQGGGNRLPGPLPPVVSPAFFEFPRTTRSLIHLGVLVSFLILFTTFSYLYIASFFNTQNYGQFQMRTHAFCNYNHTRMTRSEPYAPFSKDSHKMFSILQNILGRSPNWTTLYDQPVPTSTGF